MPAERQKAPKNTEHIIREGLIDCSNAYGFISSMKCLGETIESAKRKQHFRERFEGPATYGLYGRLASSWFLALLSLSLRLGSFSSGAP